MEEYFFNKVLMKIRSSRPQGHFSSASLVHVFQSIELHYTVHSTKTSALNLSYLENNGKVTKNIADLLATTICQAKPNNDDKTFQVTLDEIR